MLAYPLSSANVQTQWRDSGRRPMDSDDSGVPLNLKRQLRCTYIGPATTSCDLLYGGLFLSLSNKLLEPPMLDLVD